MVNTATLHEDCLYPFHPQCVQNVHPGDSYMRLELCLRLYSNRKLLPFVLFTDEAAFTVTEQTTHVTRIDGLTTILLVLWKQNSSVVSLSVWCGMINDMLIGPVILDDRMVGHSDLDFLQYGLPVQLEDIPLAARIAMYFRHDGVPTHYTRLVMQHLGDIPKAVDRTRPPSYPDLIPLDVCLWSWMKCEVFRRKVDTREELLDHMMEFIARIK